MDKKTIKQQRDNAFNNWLFKSYAVPSWLRKHQAKFIEKSVQQPVHGLLKKWLPPLEQLRNLGEQLQVSDPKTELNTPILKCSIELPGDLDLERHLQHLKPWRKGPWQFNNIDIASEWDCSLKYDRLTRYGPQLSGKTILDIGCGNGYYGFRMLGDQANYVFGVDPSPLFWVQYSTFKNINPSLPIDIMPIPGEHLATLSLQFDVVTSMGVLYHRKSPLEHLKLLKHCLNNNGELLLETLVIDDKDTAFLMPLSTYAGMANLWGLPSIGLLRQWLHITGFKTVECISLSCTQHTEQQQTPWIETHSLSDFLAPCGTKTKEGLPAPWRALFRASLR